MEKSKTCKNCKFAVIREKADNYAPNVVCMKRTNFEKGKVYTEREVNILIADYFDDFCTLRRDMIAEHILERDNMNYWLAE